MNIKFKELPTPQPAPIYPAFYRSRNGRVVLACGENSGILVKEAPGEKCKLSFKLDSDWVPFSDRITWTRISGEVTFKID